jgi:hypothetical protein
MAAKKSVDSAEPAEKATKTLLQRATQIVKILEPCTPDERRRILLSVEALSGEAAPQPVSQGTLPLPSVG